MGVETFVVSGGESAGGTGSTGGMSAGKVSGTVTGGTFSGMFIGVTGAVDRDGVVDGAVDRGGDAEDPEEVGHAETGGQASSLNNFFQLLRHGFSGFAVVTMSEFEA